MKLWPLFYSIGLNTDICVIQIEYILGFLKYKQLVVHFNKLIDSKVKKQFNLVSNLKSDW